MRYLLATLFALVAAAASSAQTQIGSPQIINYSYLNYKAGTQNWDTGQDAQGVMYFGNNEGLLTFNGKFWQLYPLPNRTVVRSLQIDSKGRIFVGGQDEVGYFFPDRRGKLVYHSLKHLIPEKERQFADIWNISIVNGQVFFRSLNKILHWKDGVLRIIKPDRSWVFLGDAKKQIFAQEESKGLVTFKNDIWMAASEDPLLKTVTITSVLEYSDDAFLVTTLKNGLYLLKDGRLSKLTSKLDGTLYNERIFCATRVNQDWYALGTTSGGVLIIDRNGNLVQKYSFSEGLQKNNIRSVFIDRHKNLWLGLDDGIDFITINSAIKQIFPDQNKQSTSYAIRLFNKRLYIGTSNGLYRSSPINPAITDLSLAPGTFSELKNTKGQVWGLDEINSHLLLAHEDGTFVVKEDAVEHLFTSPGTWLFNAMSNFYPSEDIIAGTYSGLHRISFSGGKFIDKGKLKGVDDVLRFTLFDAATNSIWASHPYHGVYKIELNKTFDKINRTTLFTDRQGLPSDLYNYVFRIKDRILVATAKGLYEYDKGRNRFARSPQYYNALKDLSIQYLKEDPAGNIWFISNKEVGIIDFNKPSKDNAYSITFFPDLKSRVVGGFETIYPMDENNIFIGANKGVFHINYQKYTENISQPDVLIGAVTASGRKDSVIFGGFQGSEQTGYSAELSKSIFNTIHFEYASTLFGQLNNIEFSYQLDGFDKAWSPWSEKSEKDYTNLPAGKYTFKVRARNNQGSSSEPVSYTFEILPRWYQSKLAVFIYIVLLLGLVNLIVKWQRKKHLREQEKLKYLHQLEIERNENEIVKLKNEKLEADVNFKNQELATTTMRLVQRGKVLAKIKEVLSNLERSPTDEKSSADFKQLSALLNEVEKRDTDWDQFAVHFDQVHSNFLSDLKERHPGLTPNELKLCAYLKMNLSSKEIAQLMNITIRAVEVSRYRLRKKLNIPSEVNLFDYLMQSLSKESSKPKPEAVAE